MKGVEPSSSEPQPDVLTVELHSPCAVIISVNRLFFNNSNAPSFRKNLGMTVRTKDGALNIVVAV